MISSFFSKTKPIHYILVLTVMFLLYFGVNFFWIDRQQDTNFIISRLAIVSFLLFSIFIVNFVAKRNKLSGTNSFVILFYVLLAFVFPDTLLDSNAIFCSLFLLMATRRIVSLKSLKETSYKLFDASLWIAVASPDDIKAKCFYFGKNRKRNIKKAALTSLDLLRREVQKIK